MCWFPLVAGAIHGSAQRFDHGCWPGGNDIFQGQVLYHLARHQPQESSLQFLHAREGPSVLAKRLLQQNGGFRRMWRFVILSFSHPNVLISILRSNPLPVWALPLIEYLFRCCLIISFKLCYPFNCILSLIFTQVSPVAGEDEFFPRILTLLTKGSLCHSPYNIIIAPIPFRCLTFYLCLIAINQRRKP